MTPCIDCGKTSVGLRCLKCHGRREQALALERTAEADAALLGISRVAANNRFRKAKHREAQRRKAAKKAARLRTV